MKLRAAVLAAGIAALLACGETTDATRCPGSPTAPATPSPTPSPAAATPAFQLTSFSPGPGAVIRPGSQLDLYGTVRLPPEMIPSWTSLHYVRDDGSDRMVWGVYGVPCDFEGTCTVGFGSYVSSSQFSDFARGHTVNAMLLVTTRYQTYLVDCAAGSPPNQSCYDPAHVKYKEFIALNYRYQE